MGIANPVSVTMNGNKTVTASYSAIEYILTVNVIGNGTVAKSPDQASYIYGDVVQLTATPAAGWSFANWSDDLYGNTNPGSITIDGNKTVTANFTENFAPNPPIGLKAWLTSVSINLDWDDSIDPNLAGYNVYRGEEGTYVKLNSSLLAASFYQDLSTTYNVTYDYQVTVVNLAGLESNPATVSTKRVIAYRSASSAANKVASSLTIPTPANIQPNDFLFAAISVQGAPTITAPSGWIKIRNDATGDNTLRQALYYKLVTAGEPPSFTWSFSSRQGASGGIVAYVGIDPINPIGASSGQANSTSSSYIAPSVTISARTELLVGFFGIASNPIVTQPGGMLEQAEIAMASGKSKVVTEIADEILMNLTGNVIDSGTRTASGDKAAVSIGQLVALLPANSGPAPDIQAPSVPVNLSATAVSPNQVDLTWTPSTDNVAVTGYGVYRDGTKIGTTTVAHYSDTTVSQDQTYIYQVDAYDAAPNYSGLSSQVSVSTPHLSQGIQFVGASMGATQGSKTTLLINRPLGAVSGDLLLATIDIRDGSTINPPPNWTKFIETNNGTSLTKITYYKVMGAGEPGSYVWTFSAPEVATGIILAYSGVDPNSPIEASAGVANSSGISLTAPPVSSSSQNSVLVTFYGLATSASITPQSSMTERAEVFGTSGKIKITSEAADEWLTSGNATGTRVATASKAEVSIGHSIVLKPAGP